MRGVEKNLLYITTWYPNNTGDAAFVKTEIKYLASQFKHIVVMSYGNSEAECVPVPPNVTVIYFRKCRRLFKYFLYILQLLNPLNVFHPMLWKEFSLIVRHKKHFLCCIKALRFFFLALRVKKQIASVITKYNIDICYTFWFTEFTLSCMLALKHMGLINSKPMCTRTHGVDLYEFRNAQFYQPFKIQMDRKISRVFFISKDGLEYYKRTFATRKSDVYKLCYLGTENDALFSPHNYGDLIHLLSVSYVVPVKRIHLIIEALARCVKCGIKLSWTHIGDGAEMQSIYRLAQEKLGGQNIVSYNFLGAKSNTFVCNYYKENQVDLFVNMSESEGLPVSIMEALSYGVPVIAPDVGGVSEIVDASCGWLLHKENCADEFVAVVKEWLKLVMTERQSKARNAYNKWNNNFNAKKNYTEFAGELVKIANKKRSNVMEKKTVIILGNGFDLALGVKTRYSNFYKSEFWENDPDVKNRLKDSEHPLVTFLRKEYENNENWFDLEKTIKKFALGIQTDSKVKAVEWEFNTLLRGKLKEYLKQAVVNFQKEKKNLKDIVDNPSPNSLVEEILSLIACEHVFVYTFNYTVINEYLHFCEEGIQQKEHCEELPNICHVHGTLYDTDIRLGFSLKKGEKINNNYNFLNKFMQPNSPGNIRADLENAKDVIIFGHSLNEIDIPYFEGMFKKHIDNSFPEQQVTIITCDKDSEMAIKSNLNDVGFRAENLFSSNTIQFLHTEGYNDNEKEMFEILKNRIKSNKA